MPVQEEHRDYLRLILTNRVYDITQPTPLQHAPHLSTQLNNTVLLKREDMHSIFSFKIRGAYNRICRLSADERRKGVICVSAGNHAQGVAMAARHLRIQATIVMPTCTPAIKYQNVERLGARVILHGDDFDQAKKHCLELSQQFGYINIPPYDDPYVIAGQATVGMEIMQQCQHVDSPDQSLNNFDENELDAIFCAVGGGGLVAGINAYVKRIFPHVKVIGVETEDANAMYRSLEEGYPVLLDQCGLFADGAAVRQVGKENFKICYGGNRAGTNEVDGIDEVVLVTNDELCAAIKDCFVETRTILEPAGALGLAGLKKYVQQNQVSGKKFCAVLSGANMNFDRLRFIAERARLGEEKEALLSVIIPERPGSFMELYECIYPRSITEFSYRYSNPDQAHIFLSFEPLKSAKTDTEIDTENIKPQTNTTGNNIQSQQSTKPTATNDVTHIVEQLNQRGMQAIDVSHNELAKTHARYLVGGRCAHVGDERLFSFTFPERPGALRKFLMGLQRGWNVSLFHYRNYGSDNGKVLVGVQVRQEEREQFDQEFLGKLGYQYQEETGNPVYLQFLK